MMEVASSVICFTKFRSKLESWTSSWKIELADCRATPPVKVTLMMLRPVSLGEFCRDTPDGVNEDGSRGSLASTVRISVVRLRLNAVMFGGVWSRMKLVA